MEISPLTELILLFWLVLHLILLGFPDIQYDHNLNNFISVFNTLYFCFSFKITMANSSKTVIKYYLMGVLFLTGKNISITNVNNSYIKMLLHNLYQQLLVDIPPSVARKLFLEFFTIESNIKIVIFVHKYLHTFFIISLGSWILKWMSKVAGG